MNFRSAYMLLKKGYSIKLPEWEGFWAWENNTIMMYCKDGRVLDIRETEDVEFTFNNIAREDWETVILNYEYDTVLSFGEALTALKNGFKVRRKGWNGKGIFLELQRPDKYSKMTHPYIYIDTTGLQTNNDKAPKDRVPWVASQTDMLAEDWEVII